MQAVVCESASLVLIKGWLTHSQFTNMNLPCASEGPGGMETRKSKRGGAHGQEIRNVLRPTVMETDTQRVNTWWYHRFANVRQTLPTGFSVTHPPPRNSTHTAPTGPCSISDKNKRRAREAIWAAMSPPVEFLSFVCCFLLVLWFPRLADLVG